MSLVRNLRGTSGSGYATPGLPVSPSAAGVSIRHPAYPAIGRSNLIMWLPSLDPTLESSSTQFGFHCGTLMSICYIITGNRPGFLTPRLISSNNEQELATIPDSMPAFDAILTGETYYYYIHGARLDERYKVLSEFSEWQFPDAKALGRYKYWAKWSEVFGAPVVRGVKFTSEISKAIHTRDRRCRLTGAAAHCGCNAAYIIPKEEGGWLKANRMKLYAKSPLLGTTNPTALGSNMCLLRCDIHRTFDKAYFTFVPKQNQLMAHFFDIHALEGGRFVHNCSLNEPGNLSAEYFFARLAWTVLPRTVNFTGPFPTKAERKRSPPVGAESSRNTSARSSTNALLPSVASRQNEATQPPGLSEQVDNTIGEARELARENEIAMGIYPHVVGSNMFGSGFDDNLELA
ncbi:hypothetical protein BDV93DRAFT_609968 [Ceratobasidium sp. AG-I]|nr:hypothetical protein BDV93DRAFT_609968 [Ceratobasidium sp. AG-I]